MDYRVRTIVAAAAIGMIVPAYAAEPQPPATCATMDEGLPPELAGWTQRSEGAIAIGEGRNVTLSPTAEVKFARVPERAAATDTFGAIMAFDVAVPGTYRVALGQGAWIDLVRDHQTLVSTAHGHGPACSTIRKIVDFDLVPGRYVLQLSGAKTARIGVMVAKK